MSLDAVTRSLKRKLNSGCPPAQALWAGKLSGGTRGSQPPPSSGSGEKPRLFAIPPPPPWNLSFWNQKEMRNVASI